MDAENAALMNLNEASSRLRLIQGLREGLNEILDATIGLLRADMGNIQLLDGSRPVLLIEAQHGFGQNFLDFFREVSAEDDSACGRALRSQERIVVEDVEVDAAYAPLRGIARTAGYRAVQSTPLIDRHGVPVGILSTHWRLPHRPSEQDFQRLDLYVRQAGDFIERCRADRTSEEREGRLHAVLRAATDAIITIDRRGIIEAINPSTERMFGYARDELVGRNVNVLMPSPYSENHDGYIKRYLATGEARIIGIGREVAGRRKDGTAFPVDLAVSEVPHLHLFVGVIRDISDRKRAEEALRRSHEELEQRVEDRTRALEEAKKEAERANAFKSRFLAAASHDLRQPLQALGLYLSVLSRQVEQPQQQDICEKMRNSRDTVADLLDALLDISKLESGSVIPEKRDFPIRGLLDRIVADNLTQAGEKALRLTCIAADCVVHSDPALLQRVIENLVANAIRYTDRGTVTIDCECNGGLARIAVSDTGIGIPEDALERVFEEYHQLDNPARDRRKGLGLGLSIVKHIARLLDHEVDVSSRPGKGSTFAITVPLGQVMEEQSHVFTPKAKDARARDPIILLIDDDAAILEATTMLLKTTGLIVHTASDGQEACSLVGNGMRPDLVVCDYRLPGANGLKVISNLRDLIAAEVPAILLTGDTSGQETERSNLGSCAVLYKPVDADRLIEVIETSLELAARRGAERVSR